MIELNKIYNVDCLQGMKQLDDESINMVMTSPPYWALRDYETTTWEGGREDCDHQVQNNIKGYEGDWQRPSRTEFNKIGALLKCQVCGKEFKGKIGNKFCSTKCLNTLSNKERTKAISEMINICSKCGAKRIDLQLGLENTFEEYIIKLCNIFDEVKRTLKKDGTCWVNIGDSYSSGNRGVEKVDNMRKSKQTDDAIPVGFNPPNRNNCGIPDKCLCQIPSRFAIEMTNRGWILRNTIIWHKPNCMPSSVKDRFTVDFEYLFFFVKNKKYYFETQREPHKIESIKRAARARTSKKLEKGEYSTSYKSDYVGYDDINGKLERGELRGVHKDGRNKRTTWSIPTKSFKEAHFAVYPEELITTPIKAGCPMGGVVLDPFMGAGTTGLVAQKQGKNFIGFELNEEYIEIANKRLKNDCKKLEMFE